MLNTCGEESEPKEQKPRRAGKSADELLAKVLKSKDAFRR